MTLVVGTRSGSIITDSPTWSVPDKTDVGAVLMPPCDVDNSGACHLVSTEEPRRHWVSPEENISGPPITLKTRLHKGMRLPRHSVKIHCHEKALLLLMESNELMKY